VSNENLQYSFLPISKLLSSSNQGSLLASIKNKFNITENISNGSQKITVKLLLEIFVFCETENEVGIAFNYGLTTESGSLGLLDYYLASCENLEVAVKQIIHFFPLISNQQYQPVLSVNSGQQLEFSIPFESIDFPIQRIRKELVFATVIALITRLNNHEWPLKIAIPQSSFSKKIYEKLTSVGIEVDFTSANYWLRLKPLQHQTLLPFNNQKTRELIKPELELMLSESKQPQTIIIEILNIFNNIKNITSINQSLVAEKMNLSESGLKRKLADTDSKFSNILASYKREKAIHFLNLQLLSIDTISERLGYSDRSSFERAFKQWTNISPSQYVQQISIAELKLEYISANEINSLPTSPKICQQIFELTQSDNFDIPDLVNLIQTDPILTGKLMSIANSAYYGGNHVADIKQAVIQVLGVDVVQNMVFSLMCCSQLKITNCAEFNLQHFWFQSLFTAEAIKALSHHAVIKTNISSSEIYLAALLHKIGDYVLVFLKPGIMNHYLKLKKYSNDFSIYKRNNEKQQILQQKIFGLSSEAIAALVLTHWGLPKTVCNLIRTMDVEYKKQPKTAKILSLLSQLSQYLFNNIEDLDIPNDFLQELAVILEVDISEINKPLDAIVNKIAAIDKISKELSFSHQ
jgi:HD-like signal output (HDOD) protein/AraC-like DNA-binding protein